MDSLNGSSQARDWHNRAWNGMLSLRRTVGRSHRSAINKYYDGVLTYSIGMAGSDDLKCARVVADHLGSKHTEIVLSADEFWDAIPEVIEAIESYDTTTVRASVGNYLVGKYISENSEAKVVFNGDGSDELTGGYLYMLAAPDSLEFNAECRRLLKDIHAFDVLRSDKSISSHGLEPRTPFLDKSFVATYLNTPLSLRNPRHFSDSSPRSSFAQHQAKVDLAFFRKCCEQGIQ